MNINIISRYTYLSMFIILLLFPKMALFAEQHTGKEQGVNSEVNYDVSLISQIQSKIEEDPILKKCKVQIRSKYGNVDISGLVDTKLQAEKIVTIAQSFEWVKDVESINLKVKNSKSPLTDTYITAKIKGLLIRNNLLDMTAPGSIQVETKNKVVYLSGSICDKNNLDSIIKIARSVKDVKLVKNYIEIKK